MKKIITYALWLPAWKQFGFFAGLEGVGEVAWANSPEEKYGVVGGVRPTMIPAPSRGFFYSCSHRSRWQSCQAGSTVERLFASGVLPSVQI